jgi:hypothetical protein
MKSLGKFPFGQPVQKVIQLDRTPRKVFVLGVYASAVHARWQSANGKTLVRALAVASEPYIFWRGENAESIIRKIDIPQESGKLISADAQFNGPSGVALDELILNPLGLDRKDVWLCDLVPHSCVNPSQQKAIEREYLPIVQEYGLTEHSVPPVPNVLADESRRMEILDELIESEANILILLGDKPIQWFLSYFDDRWKKLSDFGNDNQSYGRLYDVNINWWGIKVLPLAHPRQIAKLGRSSALWYDLHQHWLKRRANQEQLK